MRVNIALLYAIVYSGVIELLLDCFHVQKSKLSRILRNPDFIGVITRHKVVAKVRLLRQAFVMLFSPSRAQILDSVRHADFNPLACQRDLLLTEQPRREQYQAETLASGKAVS